MPDDTDTMPDGTDTMPDGTDNETMTKRIGLLLFDDVEVLDACGPFEVFSVANRVADRMGTERPFEVLTIGATETTSVSARGGLRLGVDVPMHAAPDVEIVIVPGGVIDEVVSDTAVLDWVGSAGRTSELVASICTGAFVLAAAGVLDDRPVTTHWEDIADLRRRWPGLDVVEGVRYIDHGDLATSAGISAGLDLSLHLVGRFAGSHHAEATARLMDYEWVDADPPPA